MKQRLHAALLATTMTGIMLMAGADGLAAGPALADSTIHRAAGTVEFVNAATGSVVINDREYLLSRDATSAGRKGAARNVAQRGARVEFSYREAQPLPVITEISAGR